MISFVFSLDHGATAQQEALIRSGLEARFPEVRFIFGAEVVEGYENSILPIVGEQHPTEPGRIVMVQIPNELAIEVRAAFQELLLQAATVRPS
ncbi:MAG: hypothetical protein JWQ17_1961 [Tardiphaga sp.]|nr:hypothetical protein [Tardiphaga sp.]